MATANPYHAPRANVLHQKAVDYGEIKMLSASGRIGRLRYFVYSIGLSILSMMLTAVIGGSIGGGVGAVLFIAGTVMVVVLNVLLTIQRAHDFNMTGWFILVGLVPLVGLAFWLVPGTDGDNDYGKQPPPNSGGTITFALIVPIVIVILALTAIPKYQDYVKRATSASVQLQR